MYSKLHSSYKHKFIPSNYGGSSPNFHIQKEEMFFSK